MTLLLSDSQRFSNVIKYELAPEMALCREKVTVYEAAGQTYTPGQVLGKTLVGGSATATAAAGNTGNGAMGSITVSGRAMVGNYKLVITAAATNAGAFVVTNPIGQIVGTGNVASAFNGGGLAFTLADGTSDFVAGDSFVIAVTGTVKYKIAVATATDGSDVPAGIYIADNLGISHQLTIAATTDTTVLVINRGPVKAADGALLWDASFDTAAKTSGKAALDALGIRTVVQI